jgi:hypothetical protein
VTVLIPLTSCANSATEPRKKTVIKRFIQAKTGRPAF